MKERIKNKWVKALKSGHYAKGRGQLCRVGKNHDYFCCLGVLTELYIQEYNKTHKRKIGWESDVTGGLVFEGRGRNTLEEICNGGGVLCSWFHS